jgi:hypothetical protein
LNSTTSIKLRFTMTDAEALTRAIIELTRVFHVVPSTVSDADEPVLSVEIDHDYPELADEVREIVASCGPGARELLDAA